MVFFNTPKFWYHPPSTFLKKLERAYLRVFKHICRSEYKHIPEIKTIAVGGLTVGGAGKTPVTRYIYEQLQTAGYNPVICLRGYGRSSNENILVDVNKHTFADVGDEALMLANHARVIVSKNRKEGLDIAKSIGADFFILDDGFEQRDVRPHIKILVIDGYQGAGNELLFPFGPLRESFEKRINAADIIFLLNDDLHNLQKRIPKTVISARVISDVSNIGNDIVAFSGLGMNEKFFHALKENFNVIKTFGFPDHYPYKEQDIVEILQCGYQVVTTEKDYQRLPDCMKDRVKYVPIELAVDNVSFTSAFNKVLSLR